ncbi:MULTISPECIES: hypothetical protein [Burkholderia]|uniref:Membrane protein n=1 Tax=Burkholderia cepacia TaxID=292 RepID=A0AA88Z7P5_BURCE|nr:MULTISPECIES: hypothetical protein [Burkholderia]AOI78075.1 hypothetical protein WS54_17200 [Burkholderia sp. NRF60-BP8]KGB99282.1 putative membrane protein [Burkholderia cepacia]KVA18104.1 hypothetical protein WS54_05875 [Burkholderia sp. NRF60-BP8]KVL16939.1 hypothetical protein WS95_01505 [Burkholderia sp. MSMB1826]KWE61585.1 hypothetical protein WT53_01530 [Burkholderia sp. MSMB2157WGS]
MKFSVPLAAAALTAGLLVVASPFAFAQNSPGVPGGILSDQFRLNEHPQMPFAASAPSQKYQTGKKSALRRKGDLGDPNGCNLKCPMDTR